MISVQTLDRKIWRKDQLTRYLIECLTQDQDATIDYFPEGSCSERLGMYRLLDEFCDRTGYAKHRVTIYTANMIESHPEYQIQKHSSYWYEIEKIQGWLTGRVINTADHMEKHFANFTSRSNWARLWLATMIHTDHRESALQTYHYDPDRENYNYNGYLGVDDLYQYRCDLITQAADFLLGCPRIIDVEWLRQQDYQDSIFQHGDSYYPIQCPANLNLLHFYPRIFVDVFCEANVSGQCFLATEKTWRPILAQRPFIVMSNVEFLKNLHRLGFQTFDSFWSEEYDLYGEQYRLQKIRSLLREIASWSLSHCSQMLEQMRPILEHNDRTFRSLSADQVKEVFGAR